MKNSPKGGKTQMKDKLLKLFVMMQILKDENGQDLIEYALVVALIAFAATAGMGTLANDINNAFNTIGTKLTPALTHSFRVSVRTVEPPLLSLGASGTVAIRSPLSQRTRPVPI